MVLAAEMGVEVAEQGVCKAPPKGETAHLAGPLILSPPPFLLMYIKHKHTTILHMLQGCMYIQQHISITSEGNACREQAMGMGGWCEWREANFTEEKGPAQSVDANAFCDRCLFTWCLEEKRLSGRGEEGRGGR